MTPRWAKELWHALQLLLRQPSAQLSRWERAVRYAISLAWNCYQELRHDQASQMAAALTYRTIFSLIPVLVLSLVLFNAFQGFDEMSTNLQNKIFQQFGLSSLSLPALPQFEEPAEAAYNGEPRRVFTDGFAMIRNPFGYLDVTAMPQNEAALVEAMADYERSKRDYELRVSITNTLAELTEKISNISFTSIGGVGIAILAYAAIMLAVTIENSFNRVYNAPSGRPWHLRISTYLTAIVMGPLLLSISIYFATQFLEWTRGLGFLGPMIGLLSYGFALASSWLLLFLMYVLMPNATVHLRPALIGSFVAAIMWEIGKALFKLYVQVALPYSALYGTLGLLPLFLYWVFVTWWIVLFGFELTFSLQAMGGRRFKHQLARAGEAMVFDPRSILAIARDVARSFQSGKPRPASDIARHVGLPDFTVERFSRALVDSGHFYEVHPDEMATSGYTLARDPRHIRVAELLDVAEALGSSWEMTGEGGVDPYLDMLRNSERQSVGDTKLAEIVDDTPSQPSTAPASAPAQGLA